MFSMAEDGGTDILVALGHGGACAHIDQLLECGLTVGLTSAAAEGVLISVQNCYE